MPGSTKKPTTTKEEREKARLRTAASRQRKEESETAEERRARLDSENAKQKQRRQRAKAKKEEEEAAAEAQHQEKLARRRERDRATYARKKMEQSGNTPGRGGGGRPPTHPTQPTPNKEQSGNTPSNNNSQPFNYMEYIRQVATDPHADKETQQFALFLTRDITIEQNERAGINQAQQQTIQAHKNVSQRSKQGLAELGRSTIGLNIIDERRYAGYDQDSAPVEEEQNQNPTPVQPKRRREDDGSDQNNDGSESNNKRGRPL